MAVVAYQILIAGIIVASSFFGGFIGLFLAVVLTCAWTTTHIFMPWLMFTQFGTIMVFGLACLGVLIMARLESYTGRKEAEGKKWNFMVIIARINRWCPGGTFLVLFKYGYPTFLAWFIFDATMDRSGHKNWVVFKAIFYWIVKPPTWLN